jgi:hypothetical protein
MAKGLCDPYIWEDIRSVPNAFTGLLPLADPCVSNLVNTIVSVYSVAILLAGALFSRGLTVSLYVLAAATILLIPSFMAYGKASTLVSTKVAEPFRDDVVPIQKPRPLTDTTYPTDRNPFMNVLLDEIKYNPTRPAAAEIGEKNIKITLDDFFRVEFTSDPTDVFGRTQSQRQFITMPSTTIPNDQHSYQNWLYKIPGKTCKEGGREACLPGTDGGLLPWLNYRK